MAAGSTGATRALVAAVAATGAVLTTLASPTPALERDRRRREPPRAPSEQPLSPASRPASAPALPWTASRLKHTLHADLHGDQVIVVANREPHIHEWDGDSGQMRVCHPASGLVTALEPVVRACSGVWIAHGSGSADRAAADAGGRVAIADDGGRYTLRRIWLTPDEERGYYYGFANEALWPLCHLAHVSPTFRRSDWAHYRRINERFADAVTVEADVDDPIVLVQDYHFALAPALIRARLPHAIILSFWHIPWPAPGTLAICPYADALIEGLLGSSILGFQTVNDCRNFTEAVDASLEARVERDGPTVVHRGHATAVRAYPISIEWPSRLAASAPTVDECRRAARMSLGLPADARIILAVDRIDYTKGIEERLLAFEHLLMRQVAASRPVLLQIGVPSRVSIPRYAELGTRIRAEVDRINARFIGDGPPPIVLVEQHCEPDEIARWYRAADVCCVSSRHDGMNLVAKEFIAARDDEQGVLILSRFAGASRELREAVHVNPYDVESVADAFVAALAMPADEQRIRMHALRTHVAEHNVYRWAGQMLQDAARLRDGERVRRWIRRGSSTGWAAGAHHRGPSAETRKSG